MARMQRIPAIEVASRFKIDTTAVGGFRQADFRQLSDYPNNQFV